MASLEDLAPETRDELALLARTMAENPATRKEFLRLTKTIRPDVPVPELEIEEMTRKATDEATNRVQLLEDKLREKEALDELERRRRDVVRKGKISEDDIPEVEKIMLEKGITSHETAADYHRFMREAAKPTPTTYNRNVMDETARSTLKQFWKNPQVAARDEASKALAELRKNPRPIGF